MLIESQKGLAQIKTKYKVFFILGFSLADRRTNTLNFTLYRLQSVIISNTRCFLNCVLDYNIYFTLNQLANKERYEVLKWQLFYRKKVVIHVPLQIKKIHHTHTIYKILKEPHHEEHGGQGGSHSWHWQLLCFSYNWILCLSTIVPLHVESLYVLACCCLLP
jgi:hypothetical protein